MRDTRRPRTTHPGEPLPVSLSMAARRAVVVAAALHVVYSRQHAVEASGLFFLPLTVDVAEFGFVVSNFCRGNKAPPAPAPQKEVGIPAGIPRTSGRKHYGCIRQESCRKFSLACSCWCSQLHTRPTRRTTVVYNSSSCFISPDSTRDRRLNFAGQRSAPHFLPAHNATAVSLLSLLASWAGAVASRVQDFIPSTSPVFPPPRSRFFL